MYVWFFSCCSISRSSRRGVNLLKCPYTAVCPSSNVRYNALPKPEKFDTILDIYPLETANTG